MEVKFRKRIDAEDLAGLRHFRSCFDSKLSVLVTRDSWKVDPAEGQLSIPLVPFLLAF